ncbi:hypothetical protein DFH28DRAFT_961079 [Melampsora americana]|nr:hypothetical protein DFH28DRAFT_961079 [Melampsora americana]
MAGLPMPPPSIGYDVTEFRQFFQFGLQQLRHNNKYIINDLTTLASVYQHRMSPFIVKDIDQHIRDSHPAHRLVAFYVIDSICKNLGHPYPELFKPFMERLFLSAYRDVEEIDSIAKVKFEELLGTWRTGSARGTELFGADIQRRIEDGVFGRWRHGGDMLDSQAFLNGMKQQPAVATPAEKASILYDLRRILAERERIAYSYPNDQANLTQMATLQQLEQLVANQQLTINQVEEIRQQLQPLKPSTPPPVQADPSQYTQHELPIEAAPSHYAQHELPIEALAQPPALALQPAMVDLTDPSSLANLTRLFASNPNILLQAVANPEQFLAAASQPFDPNNPLAALLQSAAHQQGLATSHERLLPANPPNLNIPSDQESPPNYLFPRHSPAPSTSSHDGGDTDVTEYQEYVLSLGIELTTSSINRASPSILADVLYGKIPQYCRQDGSRFLNGRTGDIRASAQLDAHFRLQRRAREQTNRAQQRTWAIPEADWVKSHDFGIEHERKKGDKSVGGAEEAAQNAEAAQVQTTAELKQKMVLRPTDSAEASKTCPICREGFETKFDQDEEEYYWLNAISAGKKPAGASQVVYHATCHFETMRNKARMKLKREEEEAKMRKMNEEEEKKLKAEAEAEVKVKVEEPEEKEQRLGEMNSEADDGVNRSSSSQAATTRDENLNLQLDEEFFGGVIEESDERSNTSPSVETVQPTTSMNNKRKSLDASEDSEIVIVNEDDEISSSRKKVKVIAVE